MAAKPRLWRALEGLPVEALEEVEEFVTSLKKRKGKRETPGRNGKELAEDYGRSRSEIEEAIRCELWLDAA